ncbi:MAG: SDR family NAD(P)-dependent oxidoreductase [Synechococcus sp.]
MVEEAPTTWAGLALVVGPGGIGAAVAAELKRTCPDLKVLTAGRHGPPASSLQLDLQNDSDLDGLSSSLRAQGLPLRLVFNCSGRLHGPGLTPEKRLSQIQRPALLEQFSINAIGPILLAQAVEPLLDRSQPFHFASLSARVGSIADNRSGGWYAYRAAKAAQNQLLRCLSIEWARRWPRATVTLLHPGTTDTALSKPFQSFVPPEQLFTSERAAEQLVELVLAQTPSESGAFLAWDGQSIPW